MILRQQEFTSNTSTAWLNLRRNKMPNEKKTEALVKDLLEKHGYKCDSNVTIEEQQSDCPKIRKLLKNASKSDKGSGSGYPEFIIHSEDYPQLLIVVECKALNKYHESKSKDQYASYAVDGVLLYASFLSKEYDVIALGVSGETKNDLRISHFLNLKGENKAHSIFGGDLLSFSDYNDGYIKSDYKFNQDYDALLVYSKQLNDKLHSKKIKESQRSLLISAVLIALDNGAFKASYKKQKKASQIANLLITTVKTELEDSDIPKDKIENIIHAYSFIHINTSLITDKIFILELIDEIDENINGFIKTHNYFDALGQFYIEFLRYANADKGLGIVLTPPHITQLFVELANIDKDSVVLDNCCGTGGFLISAMHEMIKNAKGNKKKEKLIKANQLVGIEFQDDIYALAASNMILHGDGKSNIIQGNCFEKVDEIKKRFKPTAALLNPPYKSHKDDPEELSFAMNALEVLEQDGRCVIITPMSCALAQKGDRLELKRKLLEKHTLEAVLSMPDELFHNSKVGVVTCVMLFKAHRPHKKNKKTWFGYWKEDGFAKVKNKGRIDIHDKWVSVRDKWLSSYLNRDEVPGYSVKKIISYSDEWCAEAYMETDYSTLTQENFDQVVLNYAMFKILNNT